MRIASIDIGTNTILLLIADVNSQGIQTILHDQQVIARLGKGVDASRIISQETFERVRSFLSEYRKTCDLFDVDIITAIGTSGLRDAKNNIDFCRYMLEHTGISIEIISGEEEAQWTYRGGISEFTNHNTLFSVIDIGGGSSEIIIGDNHSIKNKTSINIGAVRLTERILKGSPPSSEAILEATKFISTQLPKEFLDKLSATFSIGVAGTVTTLAAIRLQLPEYDAARISGFQLSFDMVKIIFNDLKTKSIDQIKLIPQISEGRADIFLAGILILMGIMESSQLNTITVSVRGLRFGIVLREIERYY